jgi:hypothetical protein
MHILNICYAKENPSESEYQSPQSIYSSLSNPSTSLPTTIIQLQYYIKLNTTR